LICLSLFPFAYGLDPPSGRGRSVSWLDPGWSFRRRVLVDAQGNPELLTDLPVKVVLDESVGFDYSHTQPNGADIRFTEGDGRALIPHWIESWNPEGASVLWARIPRVPTNATATLYLYYGNPEAGNISCGHLTFPFFDDFDQPVLHSFTVPHRIPARDGGFRGYASESPIAINIINRPAAVHAPEVSRVFMAYQDRNWDPRVLSYDLESGEFSDPVSVGDSPLTDDTHGAPALAVDENGYLYVFYGSHGSLQYFRKSSHPYRIDSWGEERTFGGQMCYPQVFFREGGLYAFHRVGCSTCGTWALIRSTDGGETWQPDRTLVNCGIGCVYALSYLDGNGTFHLVWSWHRVSGLRENLYYMRSSDGGDTWENSEGTVLTLPVGVNSPAAKIRDSEGTFCQAVCGDLKADAQGHPLILFNEGNVHTLARWTGSNWEFHPIALADHPFDAGALISDGRDHLRAYVTTTGSHPRGGRLEEFRSDNGGVTWQFGRTVSDAQVGHVMSVYPESPPDLEIVFAGAEGLPRSVCTFGRGMNVLHTFVRPSLDDRWSMESGTYELEDGQLWIGHTSDTNDMRSAFAVSEGYGLRGKGDVEVGAPVLYDQTLAFGFITPDRAYDDEEPYFNKFSLGPWQYRKKLTSGNDRYGEALDVSFGVGTRILEVNRLGDTTRYFVDGEQLGGDRPFDLEGPRSIHLAAAKMDAYMHLDWILLRPLSPNEPQVLVGPEEGDARVSEGIRTPGPARGFLGDPRPNPASTFVEIPYVLSSDAAVSLAVYDASGRRVRTLTLGSRSAGSHLETWDGKDDRGHRVGPGVYVLVLNARTPVAVRRVVLR
jgi:hypothetical protein